MAYPDSAVISRVAVGYPAGLPGLKSPLERARERRRRHKSEGKVGRPVRRFAKMEAKRRLRVVAAAPHGRLASSLLGRTSGCCLTAGWCSCGSSSWPARQSRHLPPSFLPSQRALFFLSLSQSVTPRLSRGAAAGVEEPAAAARSQPSPAAPPPLAAKGAG